MLCSDAGVGGHKTNHSLRASSATSMYSAGIPEKLIQERTGHGSLQALCTYERSNDQQQKEAVSSILSVPQEQSQPSQQHNYHRAAEKTLDISQEAPRKKLWEHARVYYKHYELFNSNTSSNFSVTEHDLWLFMLFLMQDIPHDIVLITSII